MVRYKFFANYRLAIQTVTAVITICAAAMLGYLILQVRL